MKTCGKCKNWWAGMTKYPCSDCRNHKKFEALFPDTDNEKFKVEMSLNWYTILFWPPYLFVIVLLGFKIWSWLK